MRIAIVGPTHPIKGGVSQHTTVLANRLRAAGHEVEIVSWLRQYPQRLYPGVQTVERPEFEPFEPSRHTLSWNRPDSWWREGRRLRDRDLVVFAHITPVQVPPYLIMVRALSGHASTAVVCHNVLPHERGRFDERLVRALLRRADHVVVHSEQQRDEATALTSGPVTVARLAPFMPDGFVQRTPLEGEHRRLIFFGLVRPYKGLDVLLRALARGPNDVRLRIAGEFWGGTDETAMLCRELGLVDRVEMVSGYVDANQVPALFSDVDAMVMPYRTATGSQGVWTAFEFGVPVIVTDTGHLADDVTPGVDGLVARPGDVDSLAAAIQEFYQASVPERMRAAVAPVDPETYWQAYVAALTDPLHATTKGTAVQEAAPPGGRLLHLAKLGAEQVLWLRVATGLRTTHRSRPERPTPMPPTDVLGTAKDWELAVAECRRLRLPLHRDRPKNWDALGAVSTIVHTLGTDIRVLDAGAARYSSVLPWLRLLGVRELVGNNLEFTRTTRHGSVSFEPGDITRTSYEDASFDAISCMSVIEHGVPLDPFLAESARILRPGGVLVVSTDYDQRPPDTTGKTAYGVPVKIFGPDDIRSLVAAAAGHGLELLGDLRLEHAERPVHWKRTGLDYTFIRLAFTRK